MFKCLHDVKIKIYPITVQLIVHITLLINARSLITKHSFWFKINKNKTKELLNVNIIVTNIIYFYLTPYKV